MDAADADRQYFPGSIGISCDNDPWASTYSTYLTDIQNTFIRGFETGVSLKAIVNSWKFRNVYMIECLNQYKFDEATGITIDSCYHESGVIAARGIVFGANGGNNVAVRGGSFELTNAAATQYVYDFSAAGAWTQITADGAKYLVQGDGNGVNNRRITGTAPVSFVEYSRSYVNATLGTLPMIWAPGTTAALPLQLPQSVRVGGFEQGNASIRLGRNDTDAADSTITQDASGNLVLTPYAALKLAGVGGSVGFYGAGGGTKPTVTGSKGANAALTSLLSALAGLGLITDSTT